MNSTAPRLTYLGIIPFILLGLTGLNATPVNFDAVNIYAVVILAFLGGSHWGLAVKEKELSEILIHSITLTLLTSVYAAKASFSVLGICSLFLYALFIDNLLYKKEQISWDYLAMRIQITTATCLVLILLRVLQL